MSLVALRDIPNKDKATTVGLFKNLRLEIFQVDVICISLGALRHITDEDKTTTVGLFKNLRLEIFQVYVIYDGWLSEISSMKTRQYDDGWAL